MRLAAGARGQILQYVLHSECFCTLIRLLDPNKLKGSSIHAAASGQHRFTMSSNHEQHRRALLHVSAPSLPPPPLLQNEP